MWVRSARSRATAGAHAPRRRAVARRKCVSVAKQTVWIAIALWTGFTFVGYFTPIRTPWRES